MRLLSAVVGVAVIAVTMIDFAWTTLSVSGAGPLTARLSSGIWAAFRAATRRRGSSPVLLAAGPAILLGSIVAWALLLWLGWLLVFLSGEESVVRSSTGALADLTGRIYFVGFTLSTLGVGDLAPKGGPWQVLTPVAALNGLIVLTLSIAYLLSTLSAVVAKHQLAGYIHAVGGTPDALVITGWDGRGFDGLASHLASMTPGLLHSSQAHLAYPVLHYFHAGRVEVAAGPAVAALDEALTLLEHGVAPEYRPRSAVIRPLRNAIGAFLAELEPRYFEAAPQAPPAANLHRLRAAGIPTVEDGRFAAAVAERRDRRRLLLEMVQNQGWTWDDVVRPRVPGAGSPERP